MKFLGLVCVLLVSSMLSFADYGSRADDHAPIGVMGDHLHSEGDWMMSYRVMSMPMSTLRQGTESITDASAPGMMKPLDMSMTMHMIGAMYGYSNSVTLVGMANYIDNSMSMQRMQNPATNTSVSGLGDVTVGALVNIKDTNTFKVHYGAVISLPTGSINEKASNDSTVGYAMQLGSGTVDVKPSITLRWFKPGFSMGSQTSAIIRTTQNKKGYQLGHKVESTLWVAKPIAKKFSISSRLTTQLDTGVNGTHSDIANPAQSIALNAENTGGKRALFGIGLNSKFETNTTYLSLEYLIPVYENLEGTQFESESLLVVGATHSF